MAPQPENRTVRTRNAFTLVELLVVIVIIALLAALLMPVLNGAYRTAMKSADAALINQISMGCEAYNQVFHEYPPSQWLPGAVPVIANAAWNAWPPPYSRPQQTITPWPDPQRPRLVGSAKLYAYLSGFNAIGCWDPTNVFTFNPAGWDSTNPMNNPCGALTSRGILVHLNPADNGTSEDKVYGPYYNPDEKGQTTTTIQWGASPAFQQRVFASRFARQAPPSPPANGVPETGAPILYYRANSAPTDLDGNGLIDSWDIYNYRDNFPITNPGAAAFLGDGRFHPLYAPSDGLTIKNTDYYPSAFTPLPTPNRYFGITKPFAKDAASTVYWPPDMTPPMPMVPNDANTYILISPGPDGEYFTADDVTNFNQ